MYDSIIKLISEKKEPDTYGNKVTSRNSRSVFAELKSIGQSEFYQANSTGLKPEMKFVIPDYFDYENEKIVSYKDETGEEKDYSVIRTYRNGNELEIICRRGIDR